MISTVNNELLDLLYEQRPFVVGCLMLVWILYNKATKLPEMWSSILFSYSIYLFSLFASMMTSASSTHSTGHLSLSVVYVGPRAYPKNAKMRGLCVSSKINDKRTPNFMPFVCIARIYRHHDEPPSRMLACPPHHGTTIQCARSRDKRQLSSLRRGDDRILFSLCLFSSSTFVTHQRSFLEPIQPTHRNTVITHKDL